MAKPANNVIRFPHERRSEVKSCPHCGKRSDVYRIGRLLWAYCEQHEVRWVVADFQDASPNSMDRQQLRRGLEFLSSFVEVTR